MIIKGSRQEAHISGHSITNSQLLVLNSQGSQQNPWRACYHQKSWAIKFHLWEERLILIIHSIHHLKHISTFEHRLKYLAFIHWNLHESFTQHIHHNDSGHCFAVITLTVQQLSTNLDWRMEIDFRSYYVDRLYQINECFLTVWYS